VASVVAYCFTEIRVKGFLLFLLWLLLLHVVFKICKIIVAKRMRVAYEEVA
jgi:hypothetical protein